MGIQRLDAFAGFLGYLPLTTAAMRQAAQFWATARKLGKPTADDAALDVDMILCAQAEELAAGGFDPVIASANVRHLSLFAKASHWGQIGGAR